MTRNDAGGMSRLLYQLRERGNRLDAGETTNAKIGYANILPLLMAGRVAVRLTAQQTHYVALAMHHVHF
ncbi:hypothetical protein QT319_04415 [Escherichia coli]|nr:hypothetical protein [Escherichia coli]